MEPVFLLHSVTPKPNTLYGVTRRTAPGFVGNYIHDPSTVSWYHKKQRPSKQARQKHRAAAKNSTVHDERQSSRPHSESGYETVGEQQNTSKNKPLREKVDDQETSLSAAASSNTVLKRLLKDLNRCNVFITRSQRALYQVRKDLLLVMHHVITSPAAELSRWRERIKANIFSCS